MEVERAASATSSTVLSGRRQDQADPVQRELHGKVTFVHLLHSEIRTHDLLIYGREPTFI